MAIALQADVRFAAEGSRFGIPAARLGLGYEYPGLAALARLVGPSVAKDILFSARQIEAAEALRIGLVNFVLLPDELEGRVRDYAASIAANAPLTIRAARPRFALRALFAARRCASRRGAGQRLLRQRGLPRRSPGVHEQKSTAIQRPLMTTQAQAGTPELHVDGAVATLTLRRPQQANRLEPDDLLAISEHVARVNATPAVLVLRVQATGKTFCAGYDIGQIGGSSGGVRTWSTLWKMRGR